LPGSDSDGQEPDEIAASLSPDFVGREREMGELVAALDTALSGHGQIVMLAGDPGIGKTRIVQEMSTIADARNAEVFLGHCYEGEGAPPYWPWLQIIRSHIDQSDAESLQASMGSGAEAIGEIVPELISKLPELGSPPTIDPNAARFRLFDSITTYLKNVSADTPLVLILEDLHWADASSLALLDHIAGDLATSNLLVVGTYRDIEVSAEHPLSRILGSLVRHEGFQRLQLGGLSQDEVRDMVALSVGSDVPEDMVELVHVRTEGNALFVGELLKLLAANEWDEAQGWQFTIPQEIRGVIGRRFDGLSDQCNRVLAVASVIGREFDFDLLSRMTDSSDDDLLDVVDEALEARVIEGAVGGAERYQFTHALIQQTLSEKLSPSRRVRLHARIGQALEGLYGDDLEAHADQLAHHFAQAEVILGSEKVLNYSVIAGENALRRFAYEEAVTQFERALSVKNDKDDRETAAIVSNLSRALLLKGQTREAAVHIKRAFAYYVQDEDVTSAAAVVERPHDVGLLPLLTDELAMAIDLLPEGSLQSARLLCAYGLAIGLNSSSYDQGQKALNTSLDIAIREGDLALERRIMAASANVDGFQERWQQSLEKSLRALELASEAPTDPIDALRANLWAGESLFAMGEATHVEKHAIDMLEIAESLHDRVWTDHARFLSGSISLCVGDWQTVISNVEKLTAPDSIARYSGYKAMALCHAGDFEQARAWLDDMITGNEPRWLDRYNWILGMAFMSLITNDTERLAEIEAESILGLSDNGLPDRFRVNFQYALAVASILEVDPAKAAQSYDSMLPFRNTFIRAAPLSIDRVLGDLAQIMGNSDDASLHFEEAVATCRKGDYRTELAWSLHDYAALRHAQGEREAALVLLDEALSISSALGMRPLMEKAIALKEQAESQPADKPAYPDGLTQREVEVLRLIASGKSNREIGEELFITLNTVARHVSSIFSKIDASNRVEAAGYATRNGIA
jgi:DNA-binding CsgD family transcriptional regulator